MIIGEFCGRLLQGMDDSIHLGHYAAGCAIARLALVRLSASTAARVAALAFGILGAVFAAAFVFSSFAIALTIWRKVPEEVHFRAAPASQL